MGGFFKNLGILSIIISSIGFPEGAHQGQKGNVDSSEISLVEKASFAMQAQRELISRPNNPSAAIQIEYGSISNSQVEGQKAIRVYQGQKGRPTGDLDLMAIQVGKARTLIAAQLVCEKMIPLGQWRLATVPQIMAFFIDLAPTFSLPQNPRKKGFLFWASSGDEAKDKTNKETFFSSWEGNDSQLEPHEFSDFLMRVKTTISRAQSKEEKDYYVNLLKNTREGIPVVCVFGKEP